VKALSAEYVAYVGQIITACARISPQIDDLVSVFKRLSNERIARVDLSISARCIFEMLYRSEDEPAGAASTRASNWRNVRGERSYASINGILGSGQRACAGMKRCPWRRHHSLNIFDSLLIRGRHVFERRTMLSVPLGRTRAETVRRGVSARKKSPELTNALF
jgi:hypothetical protein